MTRLQRIRSNTPLARAGRTAEDNSAALIEQALQAAKDGLVNAKLEIRDEAEDEESDEEGI